MSENNVQDSLVQITSEQLKITNLIFVEHQKLLIENDLLYKQIHNYQEQLEIVELQNFANKRIIDNYSELNGLYQQKIYDLNKEINRKNKITKGLTIGGITVSVGIVLLLILK